MHGRPSGGAPRRPARTSWPRPVAAPPAAVAAWLGTLDGAQAADAAGAGAAKAAVPAPPPGQQPDPLPAYRPQRHAYQRHPVDVPTLVHQRFGVRASRYAVPSALQPQASQILGLLFTLLGPPAFSPPVPGLRYPTTEGKYDLLRLLWRRAERQAEAAAAAAADEAAAAAADAAAAAGAPAGAADEAVRAAVERAARWRREEAEDAARTAAIGAGMTFHLRESLRKVLANPEVPQEARAIAAGRLRDRQASVAAGLAAWLDGAAAREDFGAVVLPLLRAVMRPLEAAGGYEPASDGRGGPSSAASGERMEARTAAAVAAQLPPGWSLLSKGHVVALDGRHPGHFAACKWEVDLVALDETGTAVALFEAKLANANPLMTLLTDVERCIALCDQLAAAQTVTLRVRADYDDEDGGGGEEGSGVDSAAGGGGGDSSADDEAEGADPSDSALPIALRRRARKVQREATKARRLWRDITVRVDPRLAPVYVLGRLLRRKDLRRGLASCASAEALKLASREPATFAAALAAGLAAQEAGAEAAAAAGAGAAAAEELRAGGGGAESVDALPDTPRSLESAGSADSSLSGLSGFSSGSSFSGSGGAPFPASSDDGVVRLAVAMPEGWKRRIRDSVLSRLDLITSRCTVLAIDDGAAGPKAGA